MSIMWLVLLGCVGFVLLITGAIPVRGGVALLRSPYGRILGAAILLFLFCVKVLFPHVGAFVWIISGVALLLVALICIILSLHEPVR